MNELTIKNSLKNIEAACHREQIFLTFSAIGTIFTLSWLLWYSCYGIDFTDESFYLVWISNPFNYNVSTTQFGFIYHPLYELLGGNIAELRQTNILITFCLAWALSNVFLKTTFGSQSLQSVHRFVISGAIATAALLSVIFAGLWLPTPSYNSLTLQALLVSATGMLLANKYTTRASITGWFLIGIGGWLAFMAKPTTAAALGLCIGFYLLAAGKSSVRLLMISLATAVGLLILSALVIDGSIIAFIDRLKIGVELIGMLGGGHTLVQLLRFDVFLFEERAKDIIIVSTAVIYFAAYLSQAKIKAFMYGGTLLSIAFVMASLGIVLGFIDQAIHISRFQGLLIWAVPFSVFFLGFSIYKFKGLFQISRAQWILMLTFLTFPHVYAFGTNENYWIAAVNAGIFWVLGGLVFLGPVASNRNCSALLLSLGFAVQLITVTLVQSGIETPYRQPQPLRENDYKLEIGKPGSALVLSKGFGEYFLEAINIAKQAGFKQGTPMIDLTGQSPGVLYALNAINIGQAWTIGGYPNSDKYAAEMLKKVSCEQISGAWLLAEPDGPRKMSPEILSSFGANMATDFEVVGMFKTAEGAGGYKEVRVQHLLKPIRAFDTAVTACVANRTSQQ